MPIYEYHCEPCSRTFETLVRNPDDVARCPSCGTIDVSKQFSVPAAARAEGGAAGMGLPVCEPGPAAFGCGGGRCATGMCSPD